jgi:hypothetical protein
MGNTYKYRVIYFLFLAFHTKWALQRDGSLLITL